MSIKKLFISLAAAAVLVPSLVLAAPAPVYDGTPINHTDWTTTVYNTVAPAGASSSWEGNWWKVTLPANTSLEVRTHGTNPNAIQTEHYLNTPVCHISPTDGSNVVTLQANKYSPTTVKLRPSGHRCDAAGNLLDIINITAPTNGEEVIKGQNYEITWDLIDGRAASVNIFYHAGMDEGDTPIAIGVSATRLHQTWSVPDRAGALDAYVRMAIYDVSGRLLDEAELSPNFVLVEPPPAAPIYKSVMNVNWPASLSVSADYSYVGRHETDRWLVDVPLDKSITVRTEGPAPYAIVSNAFGSVETCNINPTDGRNYVTVNGKYTNLSFRVSNTRCEPLVPLARFVAPAAGANLTVGSVYTVRWDSVVTGVSRVSIDYVVEEIVSANIVENIDASVGSVSWTVPNIAGKYAKLHMRTYNAAGSLLNDSVVSGQFLFVAPAVPPADGGSDLPDLIINFPSAGSSYASGSAVPVEIDVNNSAVTFVRVYYDSLDGMSGGLVREFTVPAGTTDLIATWSRTVETDTSFRFRAEAFDSSGGGAIYSVVREPIIITAPVPADDAGDGSSYPYPPLRVDNPWSGSIYRIGLGPTLSAVVWDSRTDFVIFSYRMSGSSAWNTIESIRSPGVGADIRRVWNPARDSAMSVEIRAEAYDADTSRILGSVTVDNITLLAAPVMGDAFRSGYSRYDQMSGAGSINEDKGLPSSTIGARCTPGSLFRSHSISSVYYCGGDGRRYVFADEPTYFTWYSDFSGVLFLDDADVAAVPVGGLVTHRPGMQMVKIQSDPKVYAVAHGGELRWVSSEDVARDLYGIYWNRYIVDVSDAFFVNYRLGASIE